jgi:5-formyltetrahydrofolate cyclo-ligase
LTSLFLEREVSQSIARNPLTESKSSLRATLLGKREAQGSQADRPVRDAALAQRLSGVIGGYPEVLCIGFYWPVAAEFDARNVLAAWLALDPSRHAALPVVVEPRAPLVFHAWSPDAAMKEGRYRIPVPHDERLVAPDLLLVPCVGFDDARYRLGYGGGYYDRTLDAWPTAKKPVTVGVAFEAGRCGAGSIPHEAHDVPLDVIVTEAQTY